MKNYLFAPFKDDNDKKDGFDELKRSILYCIDEKNIDINNAISPLILFVGRLESYYDVIISKLQDDITTLSPFFSSSIEKDACINDLKAENGKLKDKLQAVNDDYNNDHKVHNDYTDGLLEEIDELKKELKEKEMIIGVDIDDTTS